MSNDTKAGQSDANLADAEEIQDEALDQAEGGFALSGMFTKTVSTPVHSFTNLNTNWTSTINAPDQSLDDAATTFVRKRPGRKSF
ncbi:MAG: hypothetical protein AAFN27_00425 [Pseudomonadota bacterium]